ncbi:hypothetical protein AAFA46_05835 [Oscillospiraceae bacterium WX1]
MVNEEVRCFCGSGRSHADCHNHIHPKSIVARLYRLQKGTPSITGQHCRHNGFLVSEVEFVRIFDHIVRRWDREECQKVIDTALSRAASDADFPCLFLDENGACRINAARPLFCNPPDDDALAFCARRAGLSVKAGQALARSAAAARALERFVFLPARGGILIRRPAPLDVFFARAFHGGAMADVVTQAPFMTAMLTLPEEAYIASLASHAD